MAKRIDRTGQRYGKLVVQERCETNTKGGQAKWTCLCECGKRTIVYGTHLANGNTKSCGCLQREKATIAQQAHKKASGRNNMNLVLRGYERRAKERNLCWELTDEEFKTLTSRPCHYCGKMPSTVRRQRHSNGPYIYNGLDRVDNHKGYERSNVVPCCPTCNMAKYTHSLAEFHNWASNLYHNFVDKPTASIGELA